MPTAFISSQGRGPDPQADLQSQRHSCELFLWKHSLLLQREIMPGFFSHLFLRSYLYLEAKVPVSLRGGEESVTHLISV